MKKIKALNIQKLPIIITKQEKGPFVVESPVLELATQGKTLEEAKERFAEAVIIFFEEILEMDTVEEVLEQLGWVKKNSEYDFG